MRKILCQNSEQQRVFAHQLDEGTIDIARQEQRFTIIGTDYTIFGTNPQGSGKTVIQVVNGKLIEDDLKFKETPEVKDEKEELDPETECDDESCKPPAKDEPAKTE